MAKKPKECPYCAAGDKLVGTDHWIVKSVFPAKMFIKPCKAVSAAAVEQRDR